MVSSSAKGIEVRLAQRFERLANCLDIVERVVRPEAEAGGATERSGSDLANRQKRQRATRASPVRIGFYPM